ncbi:MAG TPA: hypothetical protein VGY99_18590 [Candidatus Binataceae bacterium]|jgi:hypothetical protein|nr:hypothetical protein [Candidatus Binataceae bacterium]
MVPSVSVRILALLAGFIVLCGFPKATGRVLVIPSARHHSRGSAASHEDLDEAVSRDPDRRSHDLLKFYGCWKATVTSRDLTTFVEAAQGPGRWLDQGYTICFARDLSGELEPTMSQTVPSKTRGPPRKSWATTI